MLVLTRKTGERVQIGEDIEIMVVRVSRGIVRLGISAPRRVPVLRPEVLEGAAAPKGHSSGGSIEEDWDLEDRVGLAADDKVTG